MEIRSFWMVLDVKTFPDCPPDATGRPGGSQEGPQRVPGESRGSPKASRSRPMDPQGRPREAQGSTKATPEVPEAPPRVENRGLNATKMNFQPDVRRELFFHLILLRNYYQNLLANQSRTLKNISPKLCSIKEVMLQKPWFYQGKNTLFVLSAKWQNLWRVMQKSTFP